MDIVYPKAADEIFCQTSKGFCEKPEPQWYTLMRRAALERNLRLSPARPPSHILKKIEQLE